MRVKYILQLVVLLSVFSCLSLQIYAETTSHYHLDIVTNYDKPVATPTNGGITENIPNEFQARYNLWKSELLSTEFGKNLWNKYANNKNFILIIEVSGKSKKGAGTGSYFWNDAGQLVGATIVLGANLDKGFPDPIYYPVMNSITEFYNRREINNNTVAATKFAHEFGHINLTFSSNQEKIVLENKLMPLYNSIFLKNGYKTTDQKLVDLANQMGGTPTQIWENREYWGETTALNYLIEKTNNKNFYCSLLSKINENVTNYAKGYEQRFSIINEIEKKDNCKK